MMKKRWRILIAGCLACAALCGCAKENSGGTPVTMYEVAHSIFYAPQYAAIELGYFKEEGIDLTLVNGAGADKVMTAMLAGDAISALWDRRPASILTPRARRIMRSTLRS